MEMVIVYWRDIPAQVIVKRGRTRGKAELHVRFQEAIDRAAMRAGKGSSDAYMEDWRRERVPVESAGGDPTELAQAEAQRLEGLYSDDRLLELIRAKGVAEK